MQGLTTYLKNVRAELKHVVWPTQKQATTHVILILLICAFGVALIAALDYVFTQGIAYLISR
ncbi:MAG TPA: preprotein translocase subunit SecE [Candidatus Paceibacterota bacterium]|nr:preprotein translocase subunit SecE [Candidatus Paceibacterota bacterium]